jgi:hypothetical protein
VAVETDAFFSPTSWLFVEPYGHEDLREVERLLSASAFGLNPAILPVALPWETVVRVLRVWTMFIHERAHYRQYVVGGGFSALLQRLRLIRLTTAQMLLERQLEERGALEPLPRLVATFLYRKQDLSVPTGWDLGERAWEDLIEWNSADELQASLLGRRPPRGVLSAHWSILFERRWRNRLFGEGMFRAPPISADPVRGYGVFGAAAFTGESILEVGAMTEELAVARRLLGDRADEFHRQTQRDDAAARALTSFLARELRIAPEHAIARVLLDIALVQVPDPELLGSDSSGPSRQSGAAHRADGGGLRGRSEPRNVGWCAGERHRRGGGRRGRRRGPADYGRPTRAAGAA